MINEWQKLKIEFSLLQSFESLHSEKIYNESSHHHSSKQTLLGFPISTHPKVRQTEKRQRQPRIFQLVIFSYILLEVF